MQHRTPTSSLLVLGFVFMHVTAIGLAQVPQVPPLPDRSHPLSSPVYYETLGRYLKILRVPPSGLQESPETVAIQTANAVADSNYDVEPSVIVTNQAGVPRTTTTYIKYVPIPALGVSLYPTLYYSSTTDMSNFTRANMPYVYGYYLQGDPWLDANISGSGIAPNRVYASGTAFNPQWDPNCYNNCYQNPSAIAVWRSDDGGVSWSDPPTVAASNGDPHYLLDKPSIAVSMASGSAGYVYVTYVRYDTFSPYVHDIMWARSTDGGVHFDAPVSLASGSVAAPQVVVGPTGYVYVLWVEFTNPGQKLVYVRSRRSTDYGQSWDSTDLQGPSGYLPGYYDYGYANGTRVIGSLFARFNRIANSIGVAWHEWEFYSASTTDCYFAAKTGGGWTTKVKINETNANDQFFPAFDYDYQGNYTFAWVDRRNDPANWSYDIYARYADSSGNPLGPSARLSAGLTNPSNGIFTYPFIGDYLGCWFWTFYWGNPWIIGWPGMPGGIGTWDIFLTTVL